MLEAYLQAEPPQGIFSVHQDQKSKPLATSVRGRGGGKGRIVRRPLAVRGRHVADREVGDKKKQQFEAKKPKARGAAPAVASKRWRADVCYGLHRLAPRQLRMMSDGLLAVTDDTAASATTRKDALIRWVRLVAAPHRPSVIARQIGPP